MLKVRFSHFIFSIGLVALGCSGEANTPTDQTGGRGGSGGSGASGGTTGGSTGGAGGAGGSNCPNKFDYKNYNPTMSPTLKNDIQGIFINSCALSSSCHQNGSKNHPNLGLSSFQLDGGKLNDMQLAAIREELLKDSVEVAGRKIMVPNKPEDSWMLDKLDGSNTCFACMGTAPTNNKCGDQMPGPGTPLEKPQLDLIRAWIKKGAAM
jgi:hypothetical protein